MSLKTNSLRGHRPLNPGSPSAAALGSGGATLSAPYHLASGGGGHGTMKTAGFGPGPSKPATATKEDSVLEKAGVGDRQLALKLDRLDRETKAHMRMREQEEKAMRKVGREIRKHRVFDDSSIGRRVDISGGAAGGNRLLPPILTPEGSPQNIRRVRSTPCSPVNNRKSCYSGSASHARTPASPRRSGVLAVPDPDGDCEAGFRVRLAGPGLSPAVLHSRSRSTSNLPSAAGASSPSHGTPAVAVYAHRDGGNIRTQSHPDLSAASLPAPHSPTTPNTSKQRPWERGLTPARRARTPAELAKLQGSLSYVTPSDENKNGARPCRADSNSSSPGVLNKCSEDPRFKKLTSCLVRNDDSDCLVSSSSPDDNSFEDRDGARSSSSTLAQEMVAIRITSSTPTLPPSPRDPQHHHAASPLPGRLKEPGLPLPQLMKAHHPRTPPPSPRILINTTVCRTDGQGAVVSEETVELSRDYLGGGSASAAGVARKDLIVLDKERLKPSNLEEGVQSPPFYGRTHVPDW